MEFVGNSYDRVCAGVFEIGHFLLQRRLNIIPLMYLSISILVDKEKGTAFISQMEKVSEDPRLEHINSKETSGPSKTSCWT